MGTSPQPPGHSALSPRLFQEARGKRTMPAALGLNMQHWACNLHQQDLPPRLPRSGLLNLTPTWKCQGPKEARKCVICPAGSKLATLICTV